MFCAFWLTSSPEEFAESYGYDEDGEIVEGCPAKDTSTSGKTKASDTTGCEPVVKQSLGQGTSHKKVELMTRPHY